MKKLIIILGILTILVGCTDNKKQEEIKPVVEDEPIVFVYQEPEIEINSLIEIPIDETDLKQEQEEVNPPLLEVKNIEVKQDKKDVSIVLDLLTDDEYKVNVYNDGENDLINLELESIESGENSIKFNVDLSKLFYCGYLRIKLTSKTNEIIITLDINNIDINWGLVEPL